MYWHHGVTPTHYFSHRLLGKDWTLSLFSRCGSRGDLRVPPPPRPPILRSKFLPSPQLRCAILAKSRLGPPPPWHKSWIRTCSVCLCTLFINKWNFFPPTSTQLTTNWLHYLYFTLLWKWLQTGRVTMAVADQCSVPWGFHWLTFTSSQIKNDS